ncbi:MAG TPA: zf-HC2 domain-containing protein [Bryobacteraceae bacterium]|nr:zf-HC2 domain-containing protein [Bryobacteraceae bacterium]
MDHSEAVRSEAAERYVARELSAAEQEAFEEHLFDCPECAHEVEFELAFAANVRAVSREQQEARQPAGATPRVSVWQNWRDRLRFSPVAAFSFAANFILAAALGFVVLNASRKSVGPRFIQTYFAPGPTLGAEDIREIPAGETSFLVHFPVPVPAKRTYSYEILNAGGQRELTGVLDAPASADDSLYLQVPVASLRGGVHTLVVRGDAGGDIVSWSKFRTSR